MSFGLFWGSLLVGGVWQMEASTRVDVVEGSARDGGVLSGDRVLRIGGKPSPIGSNYGPVSNATQVPLRSKSSERGRYSCCP